MHKILIQAAACFLRSFITGMCYFQMWRFLAIA